ncbi:hypothetical protein BT69DRAFT_1292570 [Atractiella rhizophila]|nr:hypothetical protein BT69DRAFT_1292570 [Atractiella rhizophila]
MTNCGFVHASRPPPEQVCFISQDIDLSSHVQLHLQLLLVTVLQIEASEKREAVEGRVTVEEKEGAKGRSHRRWRWRRQKGLLSNFEKKAPWGINEHLPKDAKRLPSHTPISSATIQPKRKSDQLFQARTPRQLEGPTQTVRFRSNNSEIKIVKDGDLNSVSALFAQDRDCFSLMSIEDSPQPPLESDPGTGKKETFYLSSSLHFSQQPIFADKPLDREPVLIGIDDEQQGSHHLIDPAALSGVESDFDADDPSAPGLLLGQDEEKDFSDEPELDGYEGEPVSSFEKDRLTFFTFFSKYHLSEAAYADLVSILQQPTFNAANLPKIIKPIKNLRKTLLRTPKQGDIFNNLYSGLGCTPPGNKGNSEFWHGELCTNPLLQPAKTIPSIHLTTNLYGREHSSNITVRNPRYCWLALKPMAASLAEEILLWKQEELSTITDGGEIFGDAGKTLLLDTVLIHARNLPLKDSQPGFSSTGFVPSTLGESEILNGEVDLHELARLRQEEPDRIEITINISTFNDNFGTYRTTHRKSGGSYCIPCRLPAPMREQLRNRFVCGFVPDGVSFEDASQSFLTSITSLSKHPIFVYDSNGKEIAIFCKNLSARTDFPAGNSQAGYLALLQTSIAGRTSHKMEEIRNEALELPAPEAEALLKSYGLRKEGCVFTRAAIQPEELFGLAIYGGHLLQKALETLPDKGLKVQALGVLKDAHGAEANTPAKCLNIILYTWFAIARSNFMVLKRGFKGDNDYIEMNMAILEGRRRLLKKIEVVFLQTDNLMQALRCLLEGAYSSMWIFEVFNALVEECPRLFSGYYFGHRIVDLDMEGNIVDKVRIKPWAAAGSTVSALWKPVSVADARRQALVTDVHKLAAHVKKESIRNSLKTAYSTFYNVNRSLFDINQNSGRLTYFQKVTLFDQIL